MSRRRQFVADDEGEDNPRFLIWVVAAYFALPFLLAWFAGKDALRWIVRRKQ